RMRHRRASQGPVSPRPTTALAGGFSGDQGKPGERGTEGSFVRGSTPAPQPGGPSQAVGAVPFVRRARVRVVWPIAAPTTRVEHVRSSMLRSRYPAGPGEAR